MLLQCYLARTAYRRNKAIKKGLIESSVLKDRTKEVFNKMNQEFNCEYSNIVKMAKRNIEEQFEETYVER